MRLKALVVLITLIIFTCFNAEANNTALVGIDKIFADYTNYLNQLYDLQQKHGKIDFRTEEYKKARNQAVSLENVRKLYALINENITDWKKLFRNEKAPIKLIAEVHHPYFLYILKKYNDIFDFKDAHNAGFFPLVAYEKRFKDLRKEGEKSNTCFIHHFAIMGVPFSMTQSLIKKNSDETLSFEFKSPKIKITCEFASLEKEFQGSVIIDGYEFKKYRDFYAQFLQNLSTHGKLSREEKENKLKEYEEGKVSAYSCNHKDNNCIPTTDLLELIIYSGIKEAENWLIKEMALRGFVNVSK